MVRVRLRDCSGSPGWGWLLFRPDGLSSESFSGSASDYDAMRDGDPEVAMRRDARLSKLLRISEARAVLEVVDSEDEAPPPVVPSVYRAPSVPFAPLADEPRRSTTHHPVPHVVICDVFGRAIGVPQAPPDPPSKRVQVVASPAAAMTIPDEDRKRIAEAMAEANRKAAQQEAEAVLAESKPATPSDAPTQPPPPPPAKADDSPVQQSLSDTRIDSRGGRRSGRR